MNDDKIASTVDEPIHTRARKHPILKDIAVTSLVALGLPVADAAIGFHPSLADTLPFALPVFASGCYCVRNAHAGRHNPDWKDTTSKEIAFAACASFGGLAIAVAEGFNINDRPEALAKTLMIPLSIFVASICLSIRNYYVSLNDNTDNLFDKCEAETRRHPPTPNSSMSIDEYRRKVSDARFEFCRENRIPWEPVYPPHLSSPSYRDEREDWQSLPTPLLTTAMKIQTSPFKPSKYVVFACESSHAR